MAFDDHVLQQIAEARFDRALVPAVDFEIVRNRALLADMAIGLHQHHPRGVAELGAAGGQLFERREPSLERASSCSRDADVARARLMLAAAAGQLGFARRPLDRDASSARCARRRPSAAAARSASTFSRSTAKIVLLDIELAERLAHALVLRRGVLHRVAQRRRGVERGEHLAAGGLDVAFEPFDLRAAPRVFLRCFCASTCAASSRARSASAAACGAPRSRCALVPGAPRVLAASAAISVARVQRLGLLPIEFLLLLAAVDVEFARVRVFPNRARAASASACSMRSRQSASDFRDAEPPPRSRVRAPRPGACAPSMLCASSR